MSSHHRFLQRSINHASFHNRLDEEDSMWRRRDHERSEDKDHSRRQSRSRSPYQQRKRSSRKSHSSDNDDREKRKAAANVSEGEFGPPLPANLGVNADRWDHAFFMQRYPNEYEKQINSSKREASVSSDHEERKKKKHSKHHRRTRTDEKSKRKHRSRS